MVSVLMCTYNRESCLKRAIDSVLNQTYKDFEFIIIDDGSTDGTEGLIKEYQDSRIKYFKLDRNSFYCYAANKGLEHCTGEYVAFMNSDDIWLPEKLEKQVRLMDEEKKYGACFTRIYLVDDEGNAVSEESQSMVDLFDKKYFSQKECFVTLMKDGNFLCHPSALVRRCILKETGNFNLLYRQLADYDLWMRMASKTEMYVLEDRLVKFLWDTKEKKQISMSTEENTIRTLNELVLIRKNVIEELTDEEFKKYFLEEFVNPSSESHLELEFEKAFFLMKCMSEAPELKVAGMEKMEQVLRLPGAMEVLREHFELDIFDIYQWNKEHMYKTPWLLHDYSETKQQLEYYKEMANQKDEYIVQQKKQLEKQNTIIEQQQSGLENERQKLTELNQKTELLNQEIKQQEELISTYANSTSWKITEPMRKIMRLLKNK